MRDTVGRAAWAIGALLAIAGLAVIAALVIDQDDEGDGSTAHAACEEFTLDELVAPATAEFPDLNDRRVSIDRNGDDWTVRSFVDAENVAGANVRTSFVCIVRDAGDEWQLLDWSTP